jgi:chromatin remodeling complex protein RSC6
MTKSKIDKKGDRKAKKKSSTKKVVKPEPVEEVVVEEVVEEEVVEEEVVSPDKKRSRRVVTKDSFLTDFNGVIKNMEDEIDNCKNSTDKNKSKQVKYLRTLLKTVKSLRNDAMKVVKQKRETTRTNNNSGFMKPVQISKEMADFTGWEYEQLKSRVDVTKEICKYIKEKDLQNPADRRQILPDENLKKLLKMDGKGKKENLTYYTLQRYIQPHFPKAVAKA